MKRTDEKKISDLNTRIDKLLKEPKMIENEFTYFQLDCKDDATAVKLFNSIGGSGVDAKRKTLTRRPDHWYALFSDGENYLLIVMFKESVAHSVFYEVRTHKLSRELGEQCQKEERAINH